MTAATMGVPTPEREGTFLVAGVKAAATIHAGTIVALDAGYAVPATKTANLLIVGRAEQSVANTATGASDGDVSVRVKRGVFRWQLSATNAPTVADLGKDAFAEDDQTIAKSNAGGAQKAGTIVGFDDAGVWVEIN